VLRALSRPDIAVQTEAGDDDALIVASRTEPLAFQHLHERYAARVYRYLHLRAASPEDAADLTQAVFLKLWQARSTYRPGKAPFPAFLFRIARNALTDAHRRRRPTLSWDGVAEVIPDQTGDPEAVALRNERLARLRRLVARLDPQKRELLALRFAGGLSAREIAPVVGKSEAAVKKQLTRIIDSLEEHYRDELD
jgi:RNA polymerase sigma-70 factor (ECF subfamily)